MDIIDFVYRLIQQFAGLSRSEVSTLKVEATEKLASYKDSDNKIALWFNQYNNHVFVKTGLAVLFIFVSNALLNSMHRDDDDEGYDEYDLNNRRQAA